MKAAPSDQLEVHTHRCEARRGHKYQRMLLRGSGGGIVYSHTI